MNLNLSTRRGKISGIVALVLFLVMLGFIIYSSITDAETSTQSGSIHQTDAITLTWDKERFEVLEYEIWIDGMASESIYGRSDSAMVGVPRGTHCFKMRKKDLMLNYSKFSDDICLETEDLMEIHIPFDDRYI